jgi:hypothetical protein
MLIEISSSMAPNRPTTARKAPVGNSATPTKTAKTADKRLPTAQTPAYQQTDRTIAWVMGVNASEAPNKRKRQASVTSATSFEDEDESLSESEQLVTKISEPQAKKRKRNAITKGKKKAAPKEKQQVREQRHKDEPVYISTERPKAPMIRSERISSYATQTWWKISSDVEVQDSQIMPGQGTVKTYNLTQMNAMWIKSLVKNLQDVAQIQCSVRGWKKTLLYCLCQANVPDDSHKKIEEKIAEIEQKRKHGKRLGAEDDVELDALEQALDEWKPRWHNEPLYELAMIEGAYKDPNIVIVRLTSTRGNFFIRTRAGFLPWMDFVKWINVDQKNMIGFKSRRGGKEWNGYEVAEYPISNDGEATEQVTEMEDLFRIHSCVAIWRTVEYVNQPWGGRGKSYVR